MSDLWNEATYDHEGQQRTLRLETAKHAASGLWSYLAMAASPQEYADRTAMAADSIQTVAAAHDVPVDALLGVFDHRFALLMEAKDNPFADDSQDSSKDDSSESKDDDSDDSDKSDDSDHDDDNGDGEPDDSDDDEDSDDTGDGDDEDDSDNDGADNSDSDDQDKDSAPPWAGKFSALAARINAGEDPLTWGGAAPFADSPARKHAADGANPVTDTNVPQGPAAPQGPDANPGPDAPTPPGGPIGTPSVPGMDGGIAETTKPRQMPEGDGTGPGMGMDGITGEFDPDLNGGDIEQGADSEPPGSDFDDSSTRAASLRTRAHKQQAIADEVRRYNPTLSAQQCYKIAERVYEQYLHKHAEDVNPLLYGDRAPVGDGPISGPLKNWSPADMKGPKTPTPGGGSPIPPKPTTPPTVGGEAAGEGAAGELAAGAGEGAAAGELLPMLLL